VKFMEGEFSHSAEAHLRFEREAKAAAQLRSPHVVQVLDHGVCEGTPYIAMELLDGEDLGKRLQKNGTIHPRDLSAVINQVCRALTKAHAVGIVHRDLKPDNIFLVRDDDREIAKVLDFGIAKSAAAALEGSNTKTGAMLGTPYYMSPEQAQGVKSVDYRSDLWSLAVIVYQCLTGHLPFDSEALGDLLMKIMVQPLPVPSHVAQVPPGFDGWWARAASRDPAGRFQTAKEFTESLQLVFGISQGPDVRLGQTPNPASNLPMMAGVHAGTGSGMLQQGGTGGVPAGTPPPQLSTTTGAQIARTFDGQGAAGLPQKRTSLIVAIVAVTIFLMTCVGAFVLIKKAPPSAPAVALPEAVQAPAPPAVVPPAVTTAPALTPPPIASVAAAAPTPAPAPAPVAEETPRTHHGGRPQAAPAGRPAAEPSPQAAPPPARPQAPAAPAKGDLGF